MLPFYKIIIILHVLQPISAAIEDCSQYVLQLSKYDEFLNGRRPTAQSLIFQNVTIQGFINAMRDKDSVEPGEKYQCGFTRWVIARSDKSASHPFSCLSLSLSDFGRPIPVEFKRMKCVSWTNAFIVHPWMNNDWNVMQMAGTQEICISDSILVIQNVF